MFQSIQLIEIADGKVRASIEHAGKLGRLAWSPDGTHLAAIGSADINDPKEGRLLVAPTKTGKFKDILKNHKGHVSSLAWADAETLVFLNDQGVWNSIQTIKANGKKNQTKLAAGGPVLSSFSISKNGEVVVFVASAPTHPSEVFALRKGQKTPDRLTQSNPWLNDMKFAEQEVVQFKARDGLDLEGILIRPLDEVKGNKYPLIMYVHGGPESHHRNGWQTSYSNPGQVAAARGMAVFYTNYRGSTGRGVAFSKLSQADPAGKEFDDVVDAVDHLINTGLVAKDKVAVTGGSYGGYATAWCSTYYSHRFAAGVMFVGISNKISKVGTTDIAEEEFLVHARKRPWDNWQMFLERSPIYHAGKGQTPLLILHGKDDPRVNVGQSRELYRHLKIRGKAPVRLVLYPGEGHGNSKAAARLDYNLRALRWLELYLKGGGGDPPPFEIEYSLEEKKAMAEPVASN